MSCTRTPLTYAILEVRCPRPGLKDVQILVVEIVRVRMTEMRCEDAGKARMMIFTQPERIDIELAISRKHRIEG